jgi:hypothetical protein
MIGMSESGKRHRSHPPKVPVGEPPEPKPNRFDRTAGPGPRDWNKGAIGDDAEGRLERRPTRR